MTEHDIPDPRFADLIRQHFGELPKLDTVPRTEGEGFYKRMLDAIADEPVSRQAAAVNGFVMACRADLPLRLTAQLPRMPDGRSLWHALRAKGAELDDERRATGEPSSSLPYADETPIFRFRSNNRWAPYGRFIVNRDRELIDSGVASQKDRAERIGAALRDWRLCRLSDAEVGRFESTQLRRVLDLHKDGKLEQ